MKQKDGGSSPEHAQYVLSLSFSDGEKDRYKELSEKAQDGRLSDKERAELDHSLNADMLLAILKSKARISLKAKRSGE